MIREEFERVLDRACDLLTENLRSSPVYHGPESFEQGVQDMLRIAAKDTGLEVSPTFHAHAFPDIRVNGYGIEVKFTKNDTWLAVGNSIFEGMRDADVKEIYVVFGKVGGEPEVRWRRYEECITHVRVSNSPRFVVEMEGDRSSLFDQMEIGYSEFSDLSREEKMHHVREYSRRRLNKGEQLWWLEESHTLPVAVQVYRTLPEPVKRQMRAEAALLCPEVVKSRRHRGKYDRAGLYLITHHGVFAPQIRDLFSAGSVGAKGGNRGHKYIVDALRDIESEMIWAAENLDEALIAEYWGQAVPPEGRIAEWLNMADAEVEDWVPSESLFLDHD